VARVIAAGYYNDPRSGDSFTADAWLRTERRRGDGPTGRIRLVDRTRT